MYRITPGTTWNSGYQLSFYCAQLQVRDYFTIEIAILMHRNLSLCITI